MTYADKQGKKEMNCRDEQTYFAVEDKRFNFNTLIPKLEIPISYLSGKASANLIFAEAKSLL